VLNQRDLKLRNHHKITTPKYRNVPKKYLMFYKYVIKRFGVKCSFYPILDLFFRRNIQVGKCSLVYRAKTIGQYTLKIGPLLAAPPQAGELHSALHALTAKTWRHLSTVWIVSIFSRRHRRGQGGAFETASTRPLDRQRHDTIWIVES
jgi:hypothetical protein